MEVFVLFPVLCLLSSAGFVFAPFLCVAIACAYTRASHLSRLHAKNEGDGVVDVEEIIQVGLRTHELRCVAAAVVVWWCGCAGTLAQSVTAVLCVVVVVTTPHATFITQARKQQSQQQR